MVWPNIRHEGFHWLNDMANVRTHGTTRVRPIDRFEEKKPLLKELLSKDYDASIIRTLKATSQALIHFDGNAYSVPYILAYKPVIIKATAYEIHVFNEHRHVALHKRSYERGIVIENPIHYEGLLATKKKALFFCSLESTFFDLHFYLLLDKMVFNYK